MTRIFTDGGSRGNPGPAAIGVYIVDEKETELYSLGQRIGVTTNNVAEYKAVIAGLTWVAEHLSVLTSPIAFFLDSLLVVSQIKGVYRVKDPQMGALIRVVRELEASIKQPIAYQHIPREKNKKADRLVNMALDNLL